MYVASANDVLKVHQLFQAKYRYCPEVWNLWNQRRSFDVFKITDHSSKVYVHLKMGGGGR